MADEKDPITCHVLDTTTGRPAAGISVTLSCETSTTTASPTFSATTNSDGRITKWEALSAVWPIDRLIHELGAEEESRYCPKGSSIWKLQFETGVYYGAGNTFWPVVELSVLVREGEHFHVPLLLGPWSFTTYRGS